MHGLEVLFGLLTAAVANLETWISKIKIRSRMQRLAGRKVKDRELVSLKAWMALGVSSLDLETARRRPDLTETLTKVHEKFYIWLGIVLIVFVVLAFTIAKLVAILTSHN
jgi:hypothetical protein